jgi:hypothetical protein
MLLGASWQFCQANAGEDILADMFYHDAVDWLLVPRLLAMGTKQHLQRPQSIGYEAPIDGLKPDKSPSTRMEVFLH